jgi:hypothetical protein
MMLCILRQVQLKQHLLEALQCLQIKAKLNHKQVQKQNLKVNHHLPRKSQLQANVQPNLNLDLEVWQLTKKWI